MRVKNAGTFLLTTVLLLLVVLNSPCRAQEYSINVSAGAFDRSGTVVSFQFPERVSPGMYRLESESGPTVLLQVDSHNTGRFMLKDLKAGSSRSYTMPSIAVPSSTPKTAVTFAVDQNTILFSSDGSPVLSFYHGENDLPGTLDDRYKRGGYIHPVYSPGGVPLTNHLDTKMHPHHYGIWSAWTKTRFQGREPDFWNIQNNTGRVHHADSVETAWQGPVHGGFKAKNYFVDLSSSVPVAALNEEWKVMVYKSREQQGYNMFDVLVTQTANTLHPLMLPEYHYGGLAFRGHGNWDNPDSVSVLTSEGYTRSNGNEKRARWVHMGGMVNGRRVGIAVLGHPDNYRAPQPVRIHPEIPYFVFSPVQLGQMMIEPGSPYAARYRYVTYDGEADPEMLDRLWNDYAYPPGVTVVAVKD
jgi:hypothetical protein